MTTMLEYPVWLCSLDDVRQFRRAGSSQTGDDTLMQTLIEEASAEFVAALNQIPLPYVKTLTLRSRYVSRHLWRYAYELQLELPLPLLSITSVAWAGDSLASSAYRLANDNHQPNRALALDPDTVNSIPDDFGESVVIVGIWGYVPHYDTTAWMDSGQDIPGGNLTAAATTVTVSDSSPFEVGDYIRVNSEVMFVSANDTDNEQLTIERGALGTTAAAHTSGDDIERFVHLWDIRGAVKAAAAYKYKTKDRAGGSVTVIEGGTVVVEDLDPAVQRTIDRHRRHVSVRP